MVCIYVCNVFSYKVMLNQYNLIFGLKCSYICVTIIMMSAVYINVILASMP